MSGPGREGTLSLAAGSVLDAGPEGTLRAAAAAGFPAAGLRLDPQATTPRRVASLRRMADDLGVDVLDVEVVRLGSGADDEHLRLAEAAGTLAARFLLTVSEHPDRDETAKGLHRMCAAVGGGPTRIAVEFMAFTAIPTLAAAVALAPADAVVLVDALHLARSGGTPADLDRICPGRIGYVQLCDAPAAAPTDLAAEARHRRSAPGAGELPPHRSAGPGAGRPPAERRGPVRRPDRSAPSGPAGPWPALRHSRVARPVTPRGRRSGGPRTSPPRSDPGPAGAMIKRSREGRPMPAVLRGLEGRNVLITGAAKGQGLSHALAFADAGADVAVLDITEPIPDIYPLATAEMIEETVREIEGRGRRAIPLPCDIRDESQVEANVSKALDFFDGRIDVLVCNAGVAAIDSIQDMRSPVVDAVIDTIVKGHMYVAKHVVPNMIGRRSGRIVNISSGVTGSGHAYLSHYVAAKHAIQGLTSAWAFELAEFGINVNCIAPATIRPGEGQGSGMVSGLAGEIGMTAEEAYETFSAGGNMPGPKWRTEVQHITDAVLFLASDNADQITGHVMRVDAGQGAK